MAVRIIAVKKSGGYIENPHEAISDYKWINELDNNSGTSDRPTMVKWVKDGGRAYVKDNTGDTADCFVNHNSRGTEFLQTKRDNVTSDNLLKLPLF